MPSSTLKYRLLPQTTIFNAEMFAISKAKEQLNETNCSRIIMTDSLSSLTELNGEQNFEHTAEKGESLKLV
jgi:hypothetical protein